MGTCLTVIAVYTEGVWHIIMYSLIYTYSQRAQVALKMMVAIEVQRLRYGVWPKFIRYTVNIVFCCDPQQ